MQDPIRVVVADDHPVILFGAEQALLKFQGIRVVARAKQSTENLSSYAPGELDTGSPSQGST